MKARILVVDDHDVVRRGVISVLASRPEWEICGECRTGREAVAAAAEMKPDVVIMDVSMPEMNGIEATRQILRDSPQIQVLVLTMHDSEHMARKVFAAGARGYILKNDAGTELVAAVEAVQLRRPYFSPKVAEAMLKHFAAQSGQEAAGGETAELLTSREREIVQLVVEGKSSKEIAAVLHITTKTVETHRGNIMNKLELHSIPELVRYAIRNHIVEC